MKKYFSSLETLRFLVTLTVCIFAIIGFSLSLSAQNISSDKHKNDQNRLKIEKEENTNQNILKSDQILVKDHVKKEINENEVKRDEKPGVFFMDKNSVNSQPYKNEK